MSQIATSGIKMNRPNQHSFTDFIGADLHQLRIWPNGRKYLAEVFVCWILEVGGLVLLDLQLGTWNNFNFAVLTSVRMDFPQALSIHNSNGRQWELGSLSTPEHQSPQPSSWNMLKCLAPTKANWIVSWNQSGSGPMCLNLAYYAFTEKVKTFIKTTGCTRCQGGCKQSNSDQWLINQDVKDNTLNFKNTFSLKFKTYHLMEVACIWEVWETNRNFVEKNIQHLKDISALTSVPYHWKPIHRKVWANPWTQAHSDFGGGKIWTQIQILQMVHPYNGQNQHSGLKHLHTFFRCQNADLHFESWAHL